MSGADPRTAGDDDALMRRFAAGDATAFEVLYQRYERPLYGFCLRYLGDADRAADAFQEAFIRVLDACDDYEPRGRFRSWLFTIARRTCVDVERVRLRAPMSREHPDGAAAAGGGSDPAAALAARDEVDRLLATLPAEQREVLLLSRYYGFTYGEIAELVDSTEAAVKQKAYRALQALRGEAKRSSTAETQHGGGR